MADLFERIEPLSDAVARKTGRALTFFEFATALAFEYFKQRRVQIVILETGLGGRLDATNVISHPLISVITRIGLDHTQYLGTTLDAVAGEKAGIIKPGRPVVCGRMPESALAVIRKVAAEKKSRLIRADETVTIRKTGGDWHGQRLAVGSSAAEYGTILLPLLGAHQMENVALTVAALEELAGIGPFVVPPETLKPGLAAVNWPGRLQVLSEKPLVLLDGAHNPDAAEALAINLKTWARGKPVGLVCGMCADKDNREFLNRFAALVNRAWLVPIRTARARSAADLLALAQALKWTASESTVAAAIGEATKWAEDTGGLVCITGSLYLVGEVLEQRGYGKQELGW